MCTHIVNGFCMSKEIQPTSTVLKILTKKKKKKKKKTYDNNNSSKESISIEK